MYGRAVAAPLDEASRWLNEAVPGADVPGLMLVIGLAEGHLLDALEARGARTRVLALEPDPAAARRFLRRRDWSAWRSSGRLVHLTGDDYAGAAEAWKIFPAATDDCVMLVHPRLMEGAATAKAARVAQTIVAGARANAAARRRFAPRYLTNVVCNIPAIQRGRDVRVLAGAYRGTPAVIAAAGPSLDEVLPELSALHRRALLIAVDTALRPLLTAGIIPQLVVGADPGAANARHFRWLPPCPDTWLVAESALDAEATRPFNGRTLWFRLARHQPWPWLNELGVDIGQLEMWGSVITAAFQLAVLAGCDPIVIVGGDMAFTNGRPYCRGTTYEFDWAYGTANGIPLDEWWRGQTSRSAARMTPDVHGRETHSTNALLQFRDWMVERAGRSGRRVVNATGGGTLHGGTIIQATLTDALKAASGEVVFPPPMLSQAPAEIGSRRIVSRAIEDASRAMSQLAYAAAPIADWKAFSGDGFDPASLARSLEEASGRLASPGNVAGGVSSGPLPDVAVAHALAEGVRRWRSLVDGASSAPVLSEERRARILVDALLLIDWMTGATAHEACTTPALHKWSRTNAAAWHDLPEPMSWVVALFEASLGHAAGELLPMPQQQSGCTTDDTAWPQDGRENAIQLALTQRLTEWLRCAASFSEETGSALWETARRMAASCHALQGSSIVPRAGAGLTLQLSASLNSSDGVVEASGPGPVTVAVDLERAGAAHLLNGYILESGDEPLAVPVADSGEFRAAMIIGSSTAVSAMRGQTLKSLSAPVVVIPHEVGPALPGRSVVAYASSDGAVCLTLHARESKCVHSNGEVTPHHRWPRGIVGELPWGEKGAVAWGNGWSDAPNVTSGYVMYRRHADDEPTVEELPFRPALGSLCGERIYWSCLASALGAWVGIGSWAPGSVARQELAGFTTFDIHGSGDLVLEPCIRDEHDAIARQIANSSWLWRVGEAPIPRVLGQLGPASHRSTAQGWTAVAYPYANVIRFKSTDGSVRTMVCPDPFRLAWSGRALVVSTFGYRTVVFDDVVSALEDGCSVTNVRCGSMFLSTMSDCRTD